MSGQISAPETEVPAPKMVKNAWMTSFLGMTQEEFASKFQGVVTDRNANATKVLGMIETSANANKLPGENLAHGLSAHGPGTDQTPRLVSGRRADQVVADAQTGKTPVETVELTGPDGAKVTVPKWQTVGDDPSNVSSRFASSRDMLRTLEEAFAQAAMLDSRVSAETKELDRQAMEVKEVKDAAIVLQAKRKANDAARLAAKQAKEALEGLPKDSEPSVVEPKQTALTKAMQDLTKASGELDIATREFRAAKELAAPGRSGLGNDRTVVSVAPGGVIGESFSVDGAALKSEDKDKNAVPLSEQEMQERYATLKHETGLTKASVVMDPAFVVDEFGQKTRAGWQVQTAFPSTEGTPQRDVTPDDYKKLRKREDVDKTVQPFKDALSEKETELKDTEAARQANKEKEQELRAAQKALEIRKGNLDPDYPWGDKTFDGDDKDVTTENLRNLRFAEVDAQIKANKLLLTKIGQDEEAFKVAVAKLVSEVKAAKTKLERKTAEGDAEVERAANDVDLAALTVSKDEEAEASKRLAVWREELLAEATPAKRKLELAEIISSAEATVKNIRKDLVVKLQKQADLAAAAEVAATEARDAVAELLTKAKASATKAALDVTGHVAPVSGFPNKKAEDEFKRKATNFAKAKETADAAVVKRTQQLVEAEQALVLATTAALEAKTAVATMTTKPV